MKRILISLTLIMTTQSVLADIVCNSSVSRYNAIYDRIYYTCSSGEYLPAHTMACASCPTGSTCPGGTYAVDANNFQGVELTITNSPVNAACADNFPTKLTAIYDRNVHNCNAGYYLPANVDSCTICPKDNYCGGGTYTFNETTAQGITACSGATPYAPAGSAVCYPRMMHLSDERPEDVIYLKSTETTTPAFHVNINGTTYHANMTTTPTYMTNASTHYFKVMVDNVEYYVCDDTTYTAE